MLTADVPADADARELLERYRSAIADVTEAVGTDRAIAETAIDPDRVEAVARGAAVDPPLTIAEGTELLALRQESPPSDALEAELRDLILLEMSSAIVDVDTLAATLNGAMDPTTVQQKVEGRQPMTLEEYAAVRHAIAAKGRR